MIACACAASPRALAQQDTVKFVGQTFGHTQESIAGALAIIQQEFQRDRRSAHSILLQLIEGLQGHPAQDNLMKIQQVMNCCRLGQRALNEKDYTGAYKLANLGLQVELDEGTEEPFKSFLGNIKYQVEQARRSASSASATLPSPELSRSDSMPSHSDRAASASHSRSESAHSQNSGSGHSAGPASAAHKSDSSTFQSKPSPEVFEPDALQNDEADPVHRARCFHRAQQAAQYLRQWGAQLAQTAARNVQRIRAILQDALDTVGGDDDDNIVDFNREEEE